MPKVSQLAQTLAFGNCSPKLAERLERRRDSMLRDFERHANRRAKRFDRSQVED
jgi:hypothetical protein